MEEYLLVYKYVGEDETFTLESSSESYLKHKVAEYSSIAERSIQYSIYEVKDNGIEEYVEYEDEGDDSN